MKVSFYTLGCKVNQYESQVMSENLAKHGYETVSLKENADVFIINSCTVTSVADAKTRQAVRRFKRNNPDSIVVLTGCMPQAYPEQAIALVEADIVMGNKNNDKLLHFIDEYIKNGRRITSIAQHEKGESFSSSAITTFDERTRAYIKIQDGCNRFCSYCIIPYSRGRVRSKPLDELKAELESVVKNGYSEVVLVGINLSSYGQDSGESFPNAVKLANDTKGIKRVRLGSLEPDHLTDEVITELSKCEKLCPQFHLSLQSGSEATLKAMNRQYTAKEFEQICNKLRQCFKDCTLTTDVMVGFAGETDEIFKESLDFVKKIGFEKVHIFPYSIRTGTRAAKMQGHIEKCEKDKRCHVMNEVMSQVREEFLSQQIGKTVSVLFETTLKDEAIYGHTENFTPVKIKADNTLCATYQNVLITAVDGDFCVGELQTK